MAMSLSIGDREFQKFEEDITDIDGGKHTKIRVTLKDGFSTASNTRPTVTTTSSEILAANPNRRYARITNLSGGTIFLKLGAEAVAGEGIRLENEDFFEITSVKLWAGSVNAIRQASSGEIEVFEGTT